MGASESSQIRIDFNRPDLFYHAGEQVTGTITFQNAQEKISIDQIFLDFTGELGFTTRETRHRRDTNGRSRTEHYTQYHQIPFLTYRFPVVQPQSGQREVTLFRGQHSWPFEVALPPILPPSSIPSSVAYPYVKYFVRIVIDKPWYKPNAKQIYVLTIFPRVNIFHHSNPQVAMPFSNNNRKKVHLEGSLLQPGVVPGQQLGLNFRLQNPKRAEIKRVEVTLIQHRQIAQSQQSETIFRMDLPGLTEFSGLSCNQTFELQIPAIYLAPTFTYMAQYMGRSLPVAYSYELKIEVKARGLFTDFKVNVPVFLGTEPTSNQLTLVNTHVEMPPASAPVYEYDEPPPSYESVVSNGKE